MILTILQAPSIEISGELEVEAHRILVGQTDISIDNLQELPFGVYGSAQAKADWKVAGENGKKHPRFADRRESHRFLLEGSLQRERLVLFPIHPDLFHLLRGNLYLIGEQVKWRQLFLETLSFFDMNSAGVDNSPRYFFFAEGQWKHPLELHLNGYWRYRKPDFICALQNVSGSFYNHPFALEEPASFEMSPSLLRLSGFNLAIADARLSLRIDKEKENTALDLTLERFPLDILSLNPLDLAITGRTHSHARRQADRRGA